MARYVIEAAFTSSWTQVLEVINIHDSFPARGAAQGFRATMVSAQRLTVLMDRAPYSLLWANHWFSEGFKAINTTLLSQTDHNI